MSVFTVDTNEELLATVATAGWPAYVEFVHDDGVNAVREFAPFDLVFADAAGGKLEGLDVTIDALTPGGVLIVDDMDPARHVDDGLSEPLGAVREQILGDPSLVAAELDFASGVIVATKRARVMAREQRLVFGEVADVYDRARPAYPESLVDDGDRVARLVAGDPVLESGCGTGKATVPFARRGADDDRARARSRHGVHRAAELRGLGRERRGDLVRGLGRAAGSCFKLVMAAQSWHWVAAGRAAAQSARGARRRRCPRVVLEPSRLARDRAAARDRRRVRTGRAGARRADTGQVAPGRRSSRVRRRARSSPTSSARSARPSTRGRRTTDATRTCSCSTRSRIIGSSTRRRASGCSPKSDARSTTPAARSRSRTSPSSTSRVRAG